MLEDKREAGEGGDERHDRAKWQRDDE